MNSDLVKKVIDSIKKDLSLKIPLFFNSIFDSEDLNIELCLGLDKATLDDLVTVLQLSNIIQKINKQSINGDYFNVNRKFYFKHRKRKADNEFISSLDDPSSGFCIILDKEHDEYRQTCLGRACKFYMNSDRICILGNFFR